MRRRDFIAGLGSAAAWPLAAAAQQGGIPVIGYLDAGAPDGAGTTLAGLRKGLSQMGYVEGRNIAIEYRWANNQLARIPGLATELVHLRVNVVVTPNLIPALAAAHVICMARIASTVNCECRKPERAGHNPRY